MDNQYNGKKFTLNGLFSAEFMLDEEPIKIENIIIPKIQRDYAQGRTTKEATRVRENFLKTLLEAVDNKPIALDFVYGNIDKSGVLTLLDGQQRLTTLFLLYWYAAKIGNVDKSDYEFLNHFSYENRPSSRDFCKKLVLYDPTFSPRISDEIIDQEWFPLDWKNDPTIDSMLTMLDSIHESFSSIENLWDKLLSGAISFYFLIIKDMGLTDDIYIKMNSRGKPLTQFEHFKAEYERTLNELDKDYSKSIIQKIDHQWTDLLWPYKDEGNIIDNSFLRYFRFICDIICYKGGGRPTGSDEFELIKLYFTGEDSLDNAITIEKYFDCWFKIQGMSIGDFFSSFISYSHEIGKIKIDQRYNINLFEDCINNYGETVSYSNRNRKFPLPRMILLYAFITYLLNTDTVSKEQFSERVRHVHNLILNSSDEISDSESRIGGNRLPDILKQVDTIILHGKVDLEGQNNFNVNQLNEESEKVEWLKTHSDSAETLYTLEDHKLLHGQIGIVGLENINYASRFESLFNCDVDLIDCALLTLGTYCQQESNGWRWQFGAKNDSSWDLLFHKSRCKNYDQTKEILYNILSQREVFTNEYLLSLKDSYINKCEEEEKFDWRYYRLKYKSFRDSNFGKYNFDDFYNKPYLMQFLKTASQPSQSSYSPFLYEIDQKHVSSAHYGKRLQYEDFYVRIKNSSLVFNSNEASGDSDEILNEISIPQKNGIDVVNRIEFCKEELAKFIAGRNEIQPQ